MVFNLTSLIFHKHWNNVNERAIPFLFINISNGALPCYLQDGIGLVIQPQRNRT